ncbi:MAG: hypothetical protein HY719_08235 [Planctomycetes bacterium]|nr:hypothetical protein [Planctomycetota bacterium]
MWRVPPGGDLAAGSRPDVAASRSARLYGEVAMQRFAMLLPKVFQAFPGVVLAAALVAVQGCDATQIENLGVIGGAGGTAGSENIQVTGTVISNLPTASAALTRQDSKSSQHSALASYTEAVKGLEVTLALSTGQSYKTTTNASGVFAFNVTGFPTGADAVVSGVSARNGQVFQHLARNVSGKGVAGGRFTFPTITPLTSAFVELARQMLGARLGLALASNAALAASLRAGNPGIDYDALWATVQNRSDAAVNGSIDGYLAVLNQGVSTPAAGESVLTLWANGDPRISTTAPGYAPKATVDGAAAGAAASAPPATTVTDDVKAAVRAYLQARMNADKNPSGFQKYLHTNLLHGGVDKTAWAASSGDIFTNMGDAVNRRVEVSNVSVSFLATNAGVTPTTVASNPKPVDGDTAVCTWLQVVRFTADGRDRVIYDQTSEEKNLRFIWETDGWKFAGNGFGVVDHTIIRFVRKTDDNNVVTKKVYLGLEVQTGDEKYKTGIKEVAVTGKCLKDVLQSPTQDPVATTTAVGTFILGQSPCDKYLHYTGLNFGIELPETPQELETYTIKVTYNNGQIDNLTYKVRYGIDPTKVIYVETSAPRPNTSIAGQSVTVVLNTAGFPYTEGNINLELRQGNRSCSATTDKEISITVKAIPVDGEKQWPMSTDKFKSGEKVEAVFDFADKYRNEVIDNFFVKKQ